MAIKLKFQAEDKASREMKRISDKVQRETKDMRRTTEVQGEKM